MLDWRYYAQIMPEWNDTSTPPNDIELIPLELIQSSRDELRKAREAYLIERGQTLEPKGINKREEI